MRVIAWDTETALSIPGLAAPPLACVSVYEPAVSERPMLLDADGGTEFLAEALQDKDAILVGFNSAYDFAVLAAHCNDKAFLRSVFEAQIAGRVRDGLLREKLLDIRERGKIAKGKGFYSLDGCAKRYTGQELDKLTWRLGYGKLIGTPIEEWPAGAREYAMTDAVAHWQVYESQTRRAGSYLDGHCRLVNESHQCRTAWAFQLMKVWGVRTEASAIDEVEAALLVDLETLNGKLTGTKMTVPVKRGKKVVEKELGVLTDSGKRNMAVIYRLVEDAYKRQGLDVPTTKTGKTATNKVALEEAGDPLLKALADRNKVTKTLTAFIPRVREGVGVPLNAAWNNPVATGRTSCRKPNLQQPPRKGGIRECFVPRPGYWYAFADYDTAELRSLAQHCLDTFGFSFLAEAFLRGLDPHIIMGAAILRVFKGVNLTYEQFLERYEAGDPDCEEARQQAKAVNFGRPGGLGAAKLIAYARGYKVELTLEQAKRLIDLFDSTWAEVSKNFKWINDLIGYQQMGTVRLKRSGRERGRCGYTDGCNTTFQAVTADGATDAVFWVSYECYCVPSSPLYGSRLVLFLHDELGIEAPIARASAAAERLGQIMVECMRKFVPDVPVKASPVLMKRWYKGAKQRRDASGRLIPFEPKKKTEERKAA